MPDAEEAVLAEETGAGLFQVRVSTGNMSFLADEPVALGGLSSGPDPFALIEAALAACTVMTMRLYARRKRWEVPKLSVRVRHMKSAPSSRDRIERQIHFDASVDAEKQDRLLHIAERCPVHQMLERGAEITTRVVGADMAPEGQGLHGRIIDALCASEPGMAEAT